MGLDSFKTEDASATGYRSTKQSVNKDLSNIKLRAYQVQMIEGSLMGDGSIGQAGKGWKFQLRNNHKEYLKYFKRNLHDQLFTDNCMQKAKSDKSTLLYTRSYSLFTELRDKWYNESGKHLPSNFTLTGPKLLHWYIEDGNLNKRDQLPRIKAAWVNHDEAKELQAQLKSIIGDCNLHIVEKKGGVPHKFRFYIPEPNKEQFFKSIGACPIQEYQYKWI